MEALKLEELNVDKLNIQAEKEVNGGAIHPIVWMAVFHVAKEAYNDWDAHKEAFNRGYNS